MRGQHDRLPSVHKMTGQRAADVADPDDCGCQPRLLSTNDLRAARLAPAIRRSPKWTHCSSSGARGRLERVPQLCSRRDAQLREEPIEVRFHGPVREIELLADLPVREALGRKLSDLELMGRQLSPAFRPAAANSFARGTQLSASPLRVAQ